MKKPNHPKHGILGDDELSVKSFNGEPIDVFDQINKYGTYEVQDTTDTDNVFPLIGPMGAGTTGITLPDIPDAVEEEARKAAEMKGEYDVYPPE